MARKKTSDLSDSSKKRATTGRPSRVPEGEASACRTLVIVRHAHRDKPLGGLLDNGLSEKGREQALEFKRSFLERWPDREPLILSSPKKRCRETVEPLAAELGLQVQVNELLNEGSSEKRAPQFLDEWMRDATELTIACSHGDWIPEFFMLSGCGVLDLRKGAWAWLELDSDGKLVASFEFRKPAL